MYHDKNWIKPILTGFELKFCDTDSYHTKLLIYVDWLK